MASLRRLLIAVPLAALVALITHEVRFGNDHDFGLGLHGLIVDFTLGGTMLLGLTASGRALLAAGHADGSVIATRLRAALPAAGAPLPFAALIAILASAMYFGVEATEPQGDGPNALAFAVAAALSMAIALLVRTAVAALAEAVTAFAARGMHRRRSAPAAAWRLAASPLPVRLRSAGGRRFGRAPPA